MKIVHFSVVVILLGLFVLPVYADWNPGDGHKMHFPQLPDPNGWDVNVTTDFMYDDWQCSGTGPVSDLHFWVSWKDDVGLPTDISWIALKIWTDMPAGDPNNVLGYSYPDQEVWSTPPLQPLQPGDWTIRNAGSGDQGWIDFQNPAPGEEGHPGFIPNNHQEYYQINIDDIPNPFQQTEGEIYWIGIHIGVDISQGPREIGWKTTLDHWNDDGVYWWTFPDQIPPENPDWREMVDPSGVSMDLAFVITPEPATMSLLALGVMGLLVRRRKRS